MSNVQYAVRVEQKIHLAKIIVSQEKLLIRHLVLLIGRLSIRIMRKETKYLPNSFALHVTSKYTSRFLALITNLAL